MKRRISFLAITALTLVALLSVSLNAPSSVLAGGATQISGIAFPPGPGECTDLPDQADFASKLTGDLEGCLYITVETATCSPGGTYRETGTEVFVADDGSGTFSTIYRFEAKYQDCTNLVGQVKGRCQHPIAAASGTGIFEGVSGRLDFKDDLAAGKFPYRGHLNW